MALDDRKRTDETGSGLDGAMQSRATRRTYFGTNVLLMLLFAFALLVLVNWLCQRHSYRRDLSQLGTYGLSDRTKNIVDTAKGKIRLTSIYPSDDPEKDRNKYLPRVQDLFDEFSAYSDDVVTQDITEDSQKRRLAARLEATFSEQAKQHRETIEHARQIYNDLREWAKLQLAKFESVDLQNGWLKEFTSFTNSTANLRSLGEEIDKQLDEIQAQTAGELPKYAEANRTIRSLNEVLKKSLEDTGKFLTELGELTRAVEAGNEPFFAETPAKLKELKALQAELSKAAGDVNDPMPDDAVPALKETARVAGKLSTWLVAEIGRIDEFTKRYPVVDQHPLWLFRRQVAILVTQATLPQMLADVQQGLAETRPQIAQIISSDLEQRKLQNALERVRKIVAEFDGTLDAVSVALTNLMKDFGQVDPLSRDLLSTEYYETQFKPQIEALDKLLEQIDKLPKLETGELGDELRQDNIIVVEANDKAKVIGFDETWPFAGRADFAVGAGDRERVFNGDAAVSQALLTLLNDKPFATVVVAHYETDVPEHLKRMGFPPIAGDIPMFKTSLLRESLEKANFKVVIWNIARDPEPPEVDKDVPVIYLVLPPPDARHIPGGASRQVDMWDAEDEAKLTERIGKSGRAVFLATYCVPRGTGPFATGPLMQYPYALRDYLRNEWGIDVDTRYRVIYGKRDTTDPTRYGVTLADWQWLPLNSFTDHPIGRPLRARRVYMLNVCPVNALDHPPAGVEAWDVLRIPERDDIWGNQNVLRTVQVITDPRSGGWIRKDLDGSDGWKDIETPFSVMAAARNVDGGKVFVTGAGLSYIDDYLGSPIARLSANERITFESPPTANVDLLVNALYWLSDQEPLIASGPILTPVIRPVDKAERRWLGLGVTLWALLVLGVGATVLFIRRK